MPRGVGRCVSSRASEPGAEIHGYPRCDGRRQWGSGTRTRRETDCTQPVHSRHEHTRFSRGVFQLRSALYAGSRRQRRLPGLPSPRRGGPAASAEREHDSSQQSSTGPHRRDATSVGRLGPTSQSGPAAKFDPGRRSRRARGGIGRVVRDATAAHHEHVDVGPAPRHLARMDYRSAEGLGGMGGDPSRHAVARGRGQEKRLGRRGYVALQHARRDGDTRNAPAPAGRVDFEAQAQEGTRRHQQSGQHALDRGAPPTR